MELEKKSVDKKNLIFLIVGIIGIVGGVICLLVGIFAINKNVDEVVFPEFSKKVDENVTYSSLTGEPLVSADLKNAPAYCIQVPNGTDGARPQAGLTRAGVVFEAIAEAGITRFAAIFQDPSTAIIGPIRSLRIYYLDWDTPFDCTIVHAGGPSDAISAVAAGGHKDLSENYAYMYRGTYGVRLWNNLFTTSAYLKQFSDEHGYNSSDINGFSRMTPKESSKKRIESNAKEILNVIEGTDNNTSEFNSQVDDINFNFGGWPNFNVHYDYDAESNTYKRSYQSGVAHEVYDCEAVDLGEKNPEDVCNLTQVSPSVVIAMIVQEGKASDDYHEAVTTVGNGDVYIFQNGIAIKGTWNKASKNDQIKFFDEDGNEVALAPGQTFVSAVPNYGSVEY